MGAGGLEPPQLLNLRILNYMPKEGVEPTLDGA